MLILPGDAKLIGGLYGGAGQNRAQIKTSSTDSAVDGQQDVFNGATGLAGGLIGFEGAQYRFDCSYDHSENWQGRQQRLLFNFNFIWGSEPEEGDYRPLLGLGVGVTDSRYDLPAATITHSSTTLALRSGMTYTLDHKQSLELVVEYSYAPSTASDNDYSGIHFTSYDLDKQQTLFLRVGYNFKP